MTVNVTWLKIHTVLLWRYLRGTDPQAGFRLVKGASDVFYPGYRFVDPRLDWWHDEAFNRFLRRFGEDEQLNTARKWMLSQLLRLTSAVEGDTAECGVYRGASSWLICATYPHIEHHVFDSFVGLSEPGPNDGSHWSAGGLACSEQEVRAALADFANVRYHAGWIPERFGDVADRRFRFVHIDVDLAQPTADSLEFFYPRVAPGGIILCDDFGQSVCPGASRVVDEFLKDRPEKMLALPDGGGFLIRGVHTETKRGYPGRV